MAQENGDYVSLGDGFLNGYKEKIYEDNGEHPFSYTVKKVIIKNGKVVVGDGDMQETITKEDTKTKIKLETKKGMIPDNTTMEITEISSGATFDKIKNTLVEIKNFKAFDITLKSNNTIIQPKGKVKISIPIPVGYEKSKLVVYRIAEDEIKAEYEVTVAENYATFETEHFSTYILGEKEYISAEDNEEETTTNKNNTKLPQTGEETNIFVSWLSIAIILGIFWLVSMLLIDREKKKIKQSTTKRK